MVKRDQLALMSVLAVTAALGCKPEFADRSSILKDNRVLAVRSDPAEAAPGHEVTYSVLVAGPSGELGGLSVDWAYCNQPKPLDELNDVSSECFTRDPTPTDDGGKPPIVPLGVGPTAGGKIPVDACHNFGPDVPQAKPGQPAGRPADPDITGGYYQPVRLVVPVSDQGNLFAIGSTRISCGLPGATREQLVEFQARAKKNENPTLLGVDIVRAGGTQPLSTDGGAPTAVKAGQKLDLRASWPDCPVTDTCGDGICGLDEDADSCEGDCKTDPHGCGGAERYVYYDLLASSVRDRHESIRVSWIATAGSFRYDHTGRTEAEYAAHDADNEWTAPAAGTDVDMWIVLRDSRGGVSWAGYRLHAE